MGECRSPDRGGVEPLDAEHEEHDWRTCSRCGGTRLYNAIGPRLGIMPDTHYTKCDTHAKRCQHLWNEINGPCAWAATLWVVDFRRVQM
ncbi:hypothetical protein CS8_075790 [Cupriavidus sp. 8B]